MSLKPTFTDTRIPAIREYVEKRLAKNDMVSLTRGQIEALLRAADPPPTKIFINLEGGLVQAVLSTVPDVEVMICDYDTEGASDDEITEIPQDDDTVADAVVRVEIAQVDPVFINRAIGATAG